MSYVNVYCLLNHLYISTLQVITFCSVRSLLSRHSHRFVICPRPWLDKFEVLFDILFLAYRDYICCVALSSGCLLVLILQEINVGMV